MFYPYSSHALICGCHRAGTGRGCPKWHAKVSIDCRFWQRFFNEWWLSHAMMARSNTWAHYRLFHVCCRLLAEFFDQKLVAFGKSHFVVRSVARHKSRTGLGQLRLQQHSVIKFYTFFGYVELWSILGYHRWWASALEPIHLSEMIRTHAELPLYEIGGLYFALILEDQSSGEGTAP